MNKVLSLRFPSLNAVNKAIVRQANDRTSTDEDRITNIAKITSAAECIRPIAAGKRLAKPKIDDSAIGVMLLQ